MKNYRGLGGTYERGATWWIHYSIRGVVHRESSKSSEEKDAIKLLKQRIGEAASGRTLGSKAERVTLRDLIETLRDDYSVRRKRSIVIDRVERHLIAHFGEKARALDLTRDKLKAYVEVRQSQLVRRDGVMVPPSNSTINGEFRLLRCAFHLMAQARRLSHDDLPQFPMLAESPARQGFVNPPEFAKLLDALPAVLRDPIAFLYHSGWRKGEMQSLEWRDIDLTGETIRLRPEHSKNRHARTLKLRGELLAIIERAAERRDLAIPFVFHRDGQPIRDLRKVWSRACSTAGLAGVLIHDLRRSAIRNMIRGGVSQHVAMMISGHRTPTVFSRYDIVDESDLDAAAQQIDLYVKEQQTRTAKIVPLRQKTA